jgi:hypothetical protein
MTKFLLNSIRFDKINSYIFILLALSTFRYYTIKFNFIYFNEVQALAIFGESCFLLLILISLIYLLKLTKKNIIYLTIISLIWSLFSITFNYDIINYIYIKKSFQIIYCFFIFIVFANLKDKLNYKLIESLIIFLIWVSTAIQISISIFVYEFRNIIFNSKTINEIQYYHNEITNANIDWIIFISFLSAIIVTLFMYFKYIKNNYIINFLIILFLIIIFINKFLIDVPYDIFDVGSFTRRSSFSWIFLSFFYLILLFRDNDLNTKYKSSLLFLIILFSYVYCTIYIFLVEILIVILFLIKKKSQIFFNISCSLILLSIFLYLLTITFYLDTYVYILNKAFNYIFNINNLGIINIKDQNFSYTYEISQINHTINKLGTELYLGLIYRAALAKIYILNISNGIYMSDNHIINIEYYSFSFINPENTAFDKSEFVTNFKYYLQKCIHLQLSAERCANYFGYGYRLIQVEVPNEYGAAALTVREQIYPGFSTSYIYDLKGNQTFNSPHNQFYDLVNHFKVLGVVLILFMVFSILKILLFTKNNTNFLIIVLSMIIILNFDSYLFYNYFNLSYFLWVVLGLSINFNLKRNTDKLSNE